MNKELTVVTVNYFSTDLIKKLSATMPDKKSLNYNWIVVDNSVDKNEISELKKINKIDIVIDQGENVGFGKANNVAVKNSKSKYYLFLNPDTKLQKNSIESLLEFMKLNDDYVMAGPGILNNDGSIQLSAAKKYPYWWSHALDYSPLLRLLVGKIGLNEYPAMFSFDDHKKDLDAVALLGACIIVRGEDFKKSKGFDERFFMYREETDLARRMMNSNKKAKYLSSAKISHMSGGASKNNFYAEFNPNYLKSSYMFLAKWHNPFYVVFCWLLGLLGSIFSSIAFGMLGLLFPSKRNNYYKISNICWKGFLLHLAHPLAIGYYIK